MASCSVRALARRHSAGYLLWQTRFRSCARALAELLAPIGAGGIRFAPAGALEPYQLALETQ